MHGAAVNLLLLQDSDFLPDGTVHFQHLPAPAFGHEIRAAAGHAPPAGYTAGPAVAAAYWVRLTRTGDLFTGAVSPDGANWTLIGTETISMPATVYVGLAVTSHNDAALNCATFDSVGGAGGWAGATPTSPQDPDGGVNRRIGPQQAWLADRGHGGPRLER